MLTAQCHCGNISITAKNTPSSITHCNCSICSRYGARWAYFKSNEVSITIRDKPPVSYRWGDEYIDFQHCPSCGCVTHYSGTGKIDPGEEPLDRIAINTRMCPIEQTKNIKIRYFDGAETWQFLD